MGSSLELTAAGLSSAGMAAAELAEQVRLRTGGAIRNLQIHVSESGIVLTGTTSSFYGKQLAQSIAMALMPNCPLDNHIEVDEFRQG